MIPLRITWKLATPWCPPALGIHLDGLIAWAKLQELEASSMAPSSYDELLADLPFGRHETPYGFVWQASLLRAKIQRGQERRYLTAKTAAQELADRTVAGQMDKRPLTTIDTVRGMFKNDALYYGVEDADDIVAYCLGDPERIAPMLGYITHLGKRTRLDHGRVASVDMQEEPSAAERWRDRVLPEPTEGYEPAIGRLTPPYWMGEGQATLWRPAN